MDGKSAQIIRYPAGKATEGPEPEKVRPEPPVPETPEASGPRRSEPASDADFLESLAGLGIEGERLLLERRRLLNEISLLRSENRWEDIVELCHPVEEKVPELSAAGLAVPLLSEAAFALGHLERFDEAIACYKRCVDAEPDHFHYHSGLAFTAYDSLYAAKGRRLMLHPAERKARIELAHRHFAAAQALRPAGVTNYYRHGMLTKQIEGKPDKALALFETAVRNWERLTDEEKKARHQERKNYVKALYQLASCLLDAARPREALETLKRCLEEDRDSDFLSNVHKHYALAKIHFHSGALDKAVLALDFAAAQADPEKHDYVFELLARTQLHRKELKKAWEAVNRVPPKRRRPYFRWTEAEVLLAHGETERARKVLMEAAERDRRARHKAYLRLARIDFAQGAFDRSFAWAREAEVFFRNQYQNPCADALFWQAAALVRLKRLEEARKAADTLGELMPWYPHLGRLRKLLRDGEREEAKA